MARATTKRPTGWVVRGSGTVAVGVDFDVALEVAMSLAGDTIEILGSPNDSSCWVFGDERQAVVEPWRGGFIVNASAYQPPGMVHIYTQLEAAGWTALGDRG